MLKVNEIFGPTIQGEGPSQGKRVMFLRLSFCNLSCSWCDSKYTWDWKNFDKTKEVHEMDEWQILQKLKALDADATKALVISGGEPLIQQNALRALVGTLVINGWWVEFETNGTIRPMQEIYNLVNQINCSPKLSNSGDLRSRRVKSEALQSLASSEKVFFKFVVGSNEDVVEVLEYVNDYSIKADHVYLMPLGKTPEELKTTTEMVRKLAEVQGFHFSSRLHIELWGLKRGV